MSLKPSFRSPDAGKREATAHVYTLLSKYNLNYHDMLTEKVFCFSEYAEGNVAQAVICANEDSAKYLSYMSKYVLDEELHSLAVLEFFTVLPKRSENNDVLSGWCSLG